MLMSGISQVSVAVERSEVPASCLRNLVCLGRVGLAPQGLHGLTETSCGDVSG